MKLVRLLSSILFYLTRVLAWGYTATTLYAGVVLFFEPAALRLTESGTRFEILYPFTGTPFLLGDYHTVYFIEMLLGIGLYGLFFWLLSNVFNTFRQEKLFTPSGITRLTRFYVANLTVPSLVLVLLSFISQGNKAMIIIIALHAILGVFAYFMAAIFKQGVSLQNEQDLYI
jgi:hypothetical protein